MEIRKTKTFLGTHLVQESVNMDSYQRLTWLILSMISTFHSKIKIISLTRNLMVHLTHLKTLRRSIILCTMTKMLVIIKPHIFTMVDQAHSITIMPIMGMIMVSNRKVTLRINIYLATLRTAPQTITSTHLTTTKGARNHFITTCPNLT